MSYIIWVVCNKLTTVWAPTRKTLVSWQFSGHYGITKYISGWRQNVINLMLGVCSAATTNRYHKVHVCRLYFPFPIKKILVLVHMHNTVMVRIPDKASLYADAPNTLQVQWEAKGGIIKQRICKNSASSHLQQTWTSVKKNKIFLRSWTIYTCSVQSMTPCCDCVAVIWYKHIHSSLTHCLLPEFNVC